MKHLCALWSVLLISPLVQAGASLKDARDALLRGNYAEAREIYEELVKEPKTKVAAAVGLSKTHQSEGSYDKALSVVDEALKTEPKNADLLARRAEVLYLRGQWEAAEKSAQDALARAEEHFLARWILGQIYRDRGDIDKADEEFRWFVKTYTQRANNDTEITEPETLHLVGLAGCERARYHNISDQFEFILQEVWGEAVKRDKNFWWAEYEAGQLYQEKYNKAAANRALDRALTINPRAAEALVAKGNAALQRFETKDAEQFAEQALKINPRLPEALRLRADVNLFAGDFKNALEDLDKAREVNPREEHTLARIAACFFLQRQDDAFNALVKQVEKRNPKAAIFYTELARRLEERRLYLDAEKYFKLAMDLQPKLPWAQNGLGLLYMRLGKEDIARKTLEKAFDIDSFNIQVSNTLKVLDHLDKYQTLETKHFRLRYDTKNDKVLAHFMAKYLEEIYDELAGKFDYRPREPILIEVFNKHEMFSGRVVAMPDLHTIGACTGRMIAMVSPRDKSKVIAKPFNWVRVIRHELVHVFNLEQTKFQIPHWFTEGLAVTYEGTAPPPRWRYLLAEKLQENDLLNLDTILLGFIRPRSPDQWHQAYLQSQLYVEYLTKTQGDKAVGKLLAAYADGLDTERALEKVCKATKAEFEKGYRAFLEDRVQKGPKQAAQKTLGLKALQEAHAKNPDDLDVAAQLAERYYSQGNKRDARKLADQVLKAKALHPIASYVKARLLSDGGDPELAFELLEKAAGEDCTETKTLRLLGRLQFENKKFDQAAKTFERCRKLDPLDPSWLTELVRIYTQAGDEDKLIGVLKEAVDLEPDDLPMRRKLAKLAKSKGDNATAEKYARQGLEIDVLDKECQEILMEALTAQNKDAELKELRKLLE
jgi:tetratricopeptide (TPR) repeat protein